MTSSTAKLPNVVVIGGGTGTSIVLSGLKQYPLNLTAVISVADSGGSTGRLRDEFGFLPVGDLRQAIAALATDTNQGYISKLLLYRFAKGQGLEGHNLGNLILTALQDMTGSTAKALSIASEIFQLRGKVYPITLKDIQLVIEYRDGTIEIGESVLDHKHGGKPIASVKTSPRASISPMAKQAIETADCIVLGPGDLYGSLLPNLIIQGVKSAFSRSRATIVYIANLMTHFTQTHNMTAADHLKVIEKHLPKPVDYILLNQQPIAPTIANMYRRQHEFPVIDDLADDPRVIRRNLINIISDKKQTYLRHHSHKIAQLIMRIISKTPER